MKNIKISVLIFVITSFVFGNLFSVFCYSMLLEKQNTTAEEGNSESMTEALTESAIDSTTEFETEMETETATEVNTDFNVSNKEKTTDEYYADTLSLEEKNEEAIRLYNEYISGNRDAGDPNIYADTNINDYTTPTGEPDRRYDTSYAFFDCNRDGVKELLVSSARDLYIITCKDGDLNVWKSWNDTKEIFKLLNNGNFLTKYYTGFSIGYNYLIFDEVGNEIFNISFGEVSGYDDDITYLFDGIKVTKEVYEALTKRYFEIGDDEIEWTTLYHNYYDGENHTYEWE